jgi:aspartyl protease family protein
MKISFFIFLFSFLFHSCEHPESKIYERNSSKNSHFQNNEELNSEDNLFYSEEANVIDMEVKNGVRYVWIEINGLNLKFIFDTGASNICISSAEAAVLYRQGTLTNDDILSTEYFQDATGKISEGTEINLRTVKIGNVVLENIKATIIDNPNAPLLLGQTVLERFGNIEIDNTNNRIILK